MDWAKAPKEKAKAKPAESRIARTTQKDKPRATFCVADGITKIWFSKRCFVIKGKCRLQFFNSLYDNKHLSGGAMPSYERLFGRIYTGNLYKAEANGAPPNKLRALRMNFNQALIAALGAPPGGGDWILTQPGQGYFLTDAVVWAHKVAREMRPGP